MDYSPRDVSNGTNARCHLHYGFSGLLARRYMYMLDLPIIITSFLLGNLCYCLK
jgi:hypothetical protein